MKNIIISLIILGLTNEVFVEGSAATDFNMDFKLTITPYCAGFSYVSGILFLFANQNNAQPTATYMSVKIDDPNIVTSTGCTGNNLGSTCYAPSFNNSLVSGIMGQDYESWIAAGGAQLYPGETVHVGFSTSVQHVGGNGLYLLWRATDLPVRYQLVSGCGSPVPYVEIHTEGKSLTFSNSCVGNDPFKGPQTMYLSGGRIEFYSKHQPLKSLNSQTKRHPLKITALDLPVNPLQRCEFATVPYDPPQDAHYIVVIFNIDSEACASRPSASQAWAEFPLKEPEPPPIP